MIKCVRVYDEQHTLELGVVLATKSQIVIIFTERAFIRLFFVDWIVGLLCRWLEW